MKPALFMLLMLLKACASIGDKPHPSEIAGTYHQVKPGDTVGKVAAIYHVDAEEIKDINGISDDRRLKVGQWLFLPTFDPIRKTIAKAQKTQTTVEKAVEPPKKTVTAMPLVFPLPGGRVFRSFSRDKANPYDGIGIQGKLGDPVVAAADGKVIFVGDDGTKFGLVVLLEHADHLITVYTHLQKASVSVGQSIKQGSVIGQVGQSGGAQSPRLHFQVRLNQRVQNPQTYLKGA